MIRQTAAAVTVFLLALGAGMLLSGRSGASQSTTPVSTSTSTTLAPETVFVQAGETVIGPVVIVAKEPRLDGTQLVVSFDMFNLAPTGDAADVIEQLGFGNTLVVPPSDLNTVHLDRWIVRTDTDEISGGTANPSARAARFEVGSGFDIGSIEAITVDSYAVLTPVSAPLELSIGNEAAQFAPGMTARLLAVTEQANTIVQVEILSDRGFNYDSLRVTGSGPGWRSAVREAEGRPRWNLTYTDTTAPDPIRLLVEGAIWTEVHKSVDVVIPEGR